MYFLNGDRIYIKPESGCVSWDAQFQSCLQQLRQINSGKKIFKLNFFIDAVSSEAYKTIQQRIREEVTRIFSESIVLGFVAQPPLTCKIIVEAFFYDFNLWKPEFIRHENGAATIFSRENTEIMVGNLQSNTDGTCRENAERLSVHCLKFFNREFSCDSIVAMELSGRYTGFRRRAAAVPGIHNGARILRNAFRHSGFPAATGIGMNRAE
jgi:hypothetical protein